MRITVEIIPASDLTPGDLFIPLPLGIARETIDEYIAVLDDVQVGAIGVSLYTGIAWGEGNGPVAENLIIHILDMEFDEPEDEETDEEPDAA